MSTSGGFEATFRIRVDRKAAWQRLTGAHQPTPGEHIWLPGFDSDVTIVDADEPARLRATKDDEPCAGTDIVVTLEDDSTGTRIHVVQSGFGDWLPGVYDMMVIGWRHIVADLQTYLVTGAHAHRHLRMWGDLGADTTTTDGGVLVSNVRDGGLAQQLGMRDGDLLVTLAGAPVASLDDLVTVLRVLQADPMSPPAEWVREAAVMAAPRADGTGPGAAS